MNRNKFVIVVLLVSLLCTMCLTACSAEDSPKESNKPFKACMSLTAAINDNSWGTGGYSGLLMAKEIPNVETSYVEQVAVGDMEESIRNFAAGGCDLVLAHGGEFSDAIKKVSAEYPQTKFSCVNCNYAKDNAASYAMNDEQLAYLAGALAAKVSKNNKVGYIGGMEIPPTLRQGAGFEQGAKDNGAEVVITFTGDFSDAAKAKEAALTQIDSGVDVIYYYLNVAGSGVLAAGKERGTKAIGSIIDQYEEAPDVIIGSTIQNVGILHALAIQEAIAGKLKGDFYLIGIEDPNAEGLSELHNVPDSVVKELEQIRQDIVKGTIVVHRADL